MHKFRFNKIQKRIDSFFGGIKNKLSKAKIAPIEANSKVHESDNPHETSHNETITEDYSKYPLLVDETNVDDDDLFSQMASSLQISNTTRNVSNNITNNTTASNIIATTTATATTISIEHRIDRDKTPSSIRITKLIKNPFALLDSNTNKSSIQTTSNSNSSKQPTASTSNLTRPSISSATTIPTPSNSNC